MAVNEQTMEQVRQWMEAHREELIRDVRRIVEIPSVSEEGGEYPYGEGCAKALEELLTMGREYGFQIANHQYRCGSIRLPGKEGAGELGLWGHLDVVPEGDGWVHPPYACTEQAGFLIGRGVQDNKGPTIADLYAMRCIRELGLPMEHSIRLVAGCCEETGMDDVVWYGENFPLPDYSIVTDTAFPVCHGEKGILELELLSPPLTGLRAASGGVASNVVPDRAFAVLDSFPEGTSLPKGVSLRRENDRVRLEAEGFTAHAASPEGGVDAIARLCHALSLGAPDWEMFRFLGDACEGFYGDFLGIACQDEASGRLTCVGSLISLEKGRLRVTFNIRYPVTEEPGWMVSKVERLCEDHGFSCRVKSLDPPNYVEKDAPFVTALTEVYRQVMGLSEDEGEPYVMGGGTYARKLPSAIAFGPGAPMNFAPLGLPAGHGNCHAPDEAQSIDNLLRAAEIYVLSLLELDVLPPEEDSEK